MHPVLFDPRRLRQGRQMRGLTCVELSEKTGFRIDVFEASIERPTETQIKRIAITLGLSENFFQNVSMLSKYTRVEPLELLPSEAFLAKRMATMKEKKQALAVASIYIEFFQNMFEDGFFIKEQFELNPLFLELQNKGYIAETKKDIEALAKEFRRLYIIERLGEKYALSPLAFHLVNLMEGSGIFVHRIPRAFGRAVPSFSCYYPITMIGLTDQYVLEADYAFELACQIGHLLLHGEVEDFNSRMFNYQREQAEEFAGALLIPTEVLLKTFGKSHRMTASALLAAKKMSTKFGVPVHRIVSRMHQKGMITNRAFNYLHPKLQGYMPGDDEILERFEKCEPKALQAIVDTAAGEVGFEELLLSMGMSRKELQGILNVKIPDVVKKEDAKVISILSAKSSYST